MYHPKFQMFSCHDLNIAAALRTLGTTEPLHWPAYASTLYFELRNRSGTPIINVLYRDDEVGIFKYIDVRECGYECSLNDFGRAMGKYLIDVETWTKECSADQLHINDTSTNGSSPFNPLYQLTWLQLQKYLK